MDTGTGVETATTIGVKQTLRIAQQCQLFLAVLQSSVARMEGCAGCEDTRVRREPYHYVRKCNETLGNTRDTCISFMYSDSVVNIMLHVIYQLYAGLTFYHRLAPF